jgi:hypothetical protein
MKVLGLGGVRIYVYIYKYIHMYFSERTGSDCEWIGPDCELNFAGSRRQDRETNFVGPKSRKSKRMRPNAE